MAGGFLVIGMTLLIGTYDYNGAGTEMIAKAIEGSGPAYAFLLKMLFSFDTITNLWLFFNNRQQFYIKIPHSTASQSGGILKGRISISLSSSFINWIFLLCPLFCFLFIFFYKIFYSFKTQ